jgi:hypothetical protein
MPVDETQAAAHVEESVEPRVAEAVVQMPLHVNASRQF